MSSSVLPTYSASWWNSAYLMQLWLMQWSNLTKWFLLSTKSWHCLKKVLLGQLYFLSFIICHTSQYLVPITYNIVGKVIWFSLTSNLVVKKIAWSEGHFSLTSKIKKVNLIYLHMRLDNRQNKWMSWPSNVETGEPLMQWCFHFWLIIENASLGTY